MKQNRARLLFLGSLLLLASVGCQTVPTHYNQVAEGQWRAKALIRDNVQSRSYIVNLGFNLIRDQKTRMDVTTALGTGVASLVVDSKEVRYILVDSKRFYFGPPQADVMRPILAMPFDPRWIQNVLLDQPIEGRNWTCSKDEQGLIKECRDSGTSVTVTWSGRRGDKKSILINHPKASVQINVQSFKPKVEDRTGLFSLEAPEGYQKFRVR